MRPAFFALLLAVALGGVAAAEPPTLEIPAEIKADQDSWVRVAPKGTAKAVAYVPQDAGLAPFPNEELTDKRKLILYAVRPGRYRFTAVGISGDEYVIVRFVVVVGNVPPPSPIDPPAPSPVDPPAPADPLVVALKTAAIADVMPKARFVAFAKGFGEAADAVKVSTTAGELNSAVGDALAKNFGEGAPKGVAGVFKTQMKTLEPVLPVSNPGKVLSAADKQLAETLFKSLKNACTKAAE